MGDAVRDRSVGAGRQNSQGYTRGMEYEETYHGERIIVTTLQRPDGTWDSKAEWLTSSGKILLGRTNEAHSTEEAARTAARSIAAAAIDRTRISTGKP
jgi:hypothetical protein